MIRVLGSDGNYHEIDIKTYLAIKAFNNTLNRLAFLWVITLIVWWFK